MSQVQVFKSSEVSTFFFVALYYFISFWLLMINLDKSTKKHCTIYSKFILQLWYQTDESEGRHKSQKVYSLQIIERFAFLAVYNIFVCWWFLATVFFKVFFCHFRFVYINVNGLIVVVARVVTVYFAKSALSFTHLIQKPIQKKTLKKE